MSKVAKRIRIDDTNDDKVSCALFVADDFGHICDRDDHLGAEKPVNIAHGHKVTRNQPIHIGMFLFHIFLIFLK
jgi:hypothetical protein